MKIFARLLFVSILHSVCACGSDGPVPADARIIDKFHTLCATKAEEANRNTSLAVAGNDNWLFLASELRHMSVGTFWEDAAAKISKASKPEWADPLPAILDFHSQLQAAGIELVIIPVPAKVAIYPDMLDASMKTPLPRIDVSHQEFYSLLRKKGVAVLDITDELLNLRSDGKSGGSLYCKTDSHWSPLTCELTARAIVEHLKGRPWMLAAKQTFQTETKTVSFRGDLAKARGAEMSETFSVRAAADDAKTVDSSSPVLLMGDSHCLVFHAGDDMLGTNFGLVDQLAIELGMPIDLLGIRGSGATTARVSLMQRTKGDSNYLAGKKLVIWCFSVREFTEAQGWRNVPIVQAAAK